MRQTPRLPLSFRNEVVIIFDWLGDIFSGIGSAIGDAMDFLGTQISNAIWDAMLKWFYEIIYGAIADFFEMMGNMGADVFDLEWVKATVKLFTLFSWGLFVAGTVVAVYILCATSFSKGETHVNRIHSLYRRTKGSCPADGLGRSPAKPRRTPQTLRQGICVA